MQASMDRLVDDFNQTLGKDRGILVSVTSITDSATIRNNLTMIANDDPGAPELPDITTSYPQTAALLAEKDLIIPLDNYFTASELDAYLPRFLDEGRFAAGLYVFPFAKSTEVLFVNQTLFDQFSQATGASLADLATFEGIAQTAQDYYRWTDALTPDISGDGKQFFAADSLFNLAQVGLKQLGCEPFAGERLQLGTPEYRRIWSNFIEPAVTGGFTLYPGYSSDLAKTGEIVCSIGSTAGVLFYGSEITYPDNTTIPVEYTILPYPIFGGGQKLAIQRGNGLIVAKSTPIKERAATIFLKWFTAPEQNMKFVASTGYLPVTHTAFATSINCEIADNENINIRKLLVAAVMVHKEYDFYIPPVFDEFDSISKEYESSIRQLAKDARAVYIGLLDQMDAEQAKARALLDLFDVFIEGR